MFKRKLFSLTLLLILLVSQSVSQASAQTFCDQARFVSDISVPDGSSFAPGASFTKTWRLQNTGTCAWTTAYSLVFAGGDAMGGTSVSLSGEVAPNQTVDISVNLTAPASAGHYKGLWKFANASGAQFGVGDSANNPFWVDINVTQGDTPQQSNAAAAPVEWVAFDFLQYAASSQWRSGAGILPFPGVTGDSRGFANFVDQPHLEDGTFDSSKGLLMAPQNKTDGYIQMTSPNILIAQGDKLETLVSCEFNAKSCYVTFRVDYMKENGAQFKFWSWKEAFDGRTYRASIDLSPLAGQAVRFVFMTLATGSASGDRALWVAPRILRTTGGGTSTPVPPTPTSVTPPTQTPPAGGVVAAPYIRQLFMKDAFNGWAIGDSYILRTTNGGVTWTNVSPPNVAYASGVTGFFSSPTAAWVLTGENKLYRTSNGGASWTAYSIPFGNGYLQFTDSYHGFALSGQGSGMNKQAVALYKTNDGGATWIKNYDNTPTLPAPGTSLPFSGHKNGMTFRDSLIGWVGGDIPMDGYVYLFRTTDAGKNWGQQALLLPAGYESANITVTSPSFFGVYNAVLPVWMGRSDGRDLYLYSTTNGGISWTRSAGFARGAEFVDFFTAKNGFTWDHSGVFRVTGNAGGSWSTVTPNVNFGDDFRGMDFVSSTTGWVFQGHADGSTSLYKTVDGGVTWTLLSTNRPGSNPTDTPTPPPGACDKAAFVTDVTILDGTLFAPNTPFTKTWRLKNTGSCAWTPSYKLVFQNGDQMSAPVSVNLPASVAPDQTVDLSVNLVAPAAEGKYRGYWILNNASGTPFGIGENANSPFWVEINVSGSVPDTGYDFTANACSAQWKSGGGNLPCPGADGTYNGFVIKLDAPVMEDGSVAAPGLLTSPQRKYDGYIQGFYPEFTVQAGDRFQAKVGCQQGYGACYVTYRLNYMTSNGWIGTFWQWREASDGKYYTADVDLTPLAGKNVRFILTTLAAGYATDDRAIWSAPRIVRASAPVTVTPPPPPTIAPSPTATTWLTYSSLPYGFQFQYPSGSTVYGQVVNSALISLPIVQGTTLVEKYLDLRVLENTQTCAAPMVGASPTRESVTINGVPFLKDTGMEGGMSQIRKWVAYNTVRDNLCVSFLFVLHSAHASEPPLPDYDEAAESAVFLQMMQTFAWLTPGSATPASSSQPLPDLAITQMKIELQNTSCLNPGDSPGVRVWVTNNGQAAAGSFTVTVNGIQQAVSGLAAGETKALFFTGFTNPVSALVDSAAAVAESDETNNSRSELVPVPTAPLPCAASTSTPIPQDLSTFAQSLVTALNAKNFDQVKGMMDTSFGFAFWGSQGISSTPDQAVESLRTNYLGATPLAADPNATLSALLDGRDPFSVMGLDPAKSYALYVTGWGLDGKAEAILYATRRADGTPYFHSVLIAPTGFTHVTPTPAALIGPYAVVRVAQNDVLNIRAGAGESFLVVGTFASDATNVMKTGATQMVGGSEWWEVQNPNGGTGWVNSSFLTEYVAHDAFCADTRVLPLIEQFRQSLNQSDGNLLSALVSPAHGVNFHLWKYGPGINFTQAAAKNIFTDTASYNWGGGPSGVPDVGTFKDAVQPDYLDALNAANRETYCDTLTKVFPLYDPWPYHTIRYYNLYKPATPGIDFDFRSLLVGIEFVNNQPYLYSVITIVWEP